MGIIQREHRYAPLVLGERVSGQGNELFEMCDELETLLKGKVKKDKSVQLSHLSFSVVDWDI